MWIRYKILLSILLLLSGSCAIVPRFPRIAGIEGFRVQKNTLGGLHADVDVRVYNPNFFGFTVRELDYKAYVRGRYLGKGEIIGPVHLAAGDTVLLDDQPVFISYCNFREILNAQPWLDSVPVTFLIRAKSNISSLPVYYVKTLWLRPGDFLSASINPHNINRLLSVSSVRIKYVDYLTSRLEVVLRLKNDFPLDYTIDSLCLTVYDRYEHSMGDVKLSQVYVREFTDVDLFFSLSLDNLNMAISLFGQSIGEDISYKAQGKMYLTIHGFKFVLPIRQSLGLKIEWLE